MEPWYEFETLCDVCGSTVTHRIRTTGDSVYCSKACRRLEQFLRMRTKRYGITPNVFRKMLADQRGQCAICLTALGEFARSENLMQIDHDHVSGRVRGLLCRRCNLGLAVFKDDAERLESAAIYIRTHRIEADDR